MAPKEANRYMSYEYRCTVMSFRYTDIDIDDVGSM